MNRKRCAILISGRGSNMRALITAAKRPDFPAEIALVIANRPDAPGLDFAAKEGIATAGLDHTAFSTRESFDELLHKTLMSHHIDFAACAGYMRIFSSAFAQRWAGRMINIHPSLLPCFKGLNTHQRALDAGVKIHGCSVHYVVPDLDAGPIIAQAAVAVMGDDDAERLGARVLACEHQLYPHALAMAVSGRVDMKDGRLLEHYSAPPCPPLYQPPLGDF